MLRFLLTILLMISALCLSAQQQVDRTPALDSVQQILGGQLQELENMILQNPNQPGVLKAFAPYLDDERPWLFELGHHGTYSQSFGSKVAELLKRKSDFVHLRVTDSLNAAEWNAYLAEYGPQIVFSPFLDRFTDVPLDQRDLDYRLRERRPKPNPLGNLDHQIKEINRRIKYKHYGDVASIIGNIGRFKTPEAYRFLEECANGRHWGKGINDKEEYVYVSICKALGEFPTRASAELILRIAEEQQLGNNPYVTSSLTRITNLRPTTTGKDTIDELEWFRNKMKDFPTLPEMIQHGYNLMAPFTKDDYEDPVDYYGNLLLGSRGLPWINASALRDVLATGAPTSLAFAGPQISQQSPETDNYGWPADLDIRCLLEELTDVTVEVRTAEGEWTDQYPDEFSRYQYAAYWMQHWNDYSWEETTGKYLNGVDAIFPFDSVSYWFDQLYQPLKEPALTAYFRLTEQDSARVDARLTHYDMGTMADDFSDHLPLFSNKFLPQLTRLSAWYRSEKIDYHMSPRLQSMVDRLNEDIPPHKRLRLEDSIIRVLRPEDIIPFEYYFIIRSQNTWRLRNGQSRILDRWYGKNWRSLLESPQELRAYLKRAHHYDLLGIIGNQNKYTQRFRDAGPELVAALNRIRDGDADPAIRRQAATALTFTKPADTRSDDRPAKPKTDEPAEELPDTLLEYVTEQSQVLSRPDKGAFFSKLYYNNEFKRLLKSNALPADLKQEMESSLEYHLANLEEWQGLLRSTTAAMLESVRFGDRPVGERISKVLADTTLEAPRDILKNILEGVDYSELPDVCDALIGTEIEHFGWVTLLINDWGIPLLFPDSVSYMKQLSADLRSLPVPNFYSKYLDPYQLDLQPNGEWDFLRVYDILEFDTVDGFVGGGGGRYNNEYVYALIRLLELEFNDRLGEPKKFNNLIKSRGFSRAARSAKWQRYLLDNGLVELPEGYVGSVSNVADR